MRIVRYTTSSPTKRLTPELSDSDVEYTDRFRVGDFTITFPVAVTGPRLLTPLDIAPELA